MKLYKGIRITLLGCLPWLLAACADNDIAGSGSDITGSGNSDLSEVTFNVSIQGISSTRNDGQGNGAISCGSKIDRLVYAIYSSEKGKDNFSLDQLYGDKDSGYQTTVDFMAGQTYSFTIKVSHEKDYKAVFWAQNSECKAYDTSNLEAIEISYENAANNDELRDAFTNVVAFSGDQRYLQKSAVLTRPFAQINIGTSGADYANLIYDPLLNPNGVTVTESTVTVKRVADRFDAVSGKASVKKGNDNKENLTATFKWATLPAWIDNELPAFGNYSLDENPFVNKNSSKPEEFLKVSLNDNDSFADYKTGYPTLIYEKKTDGTDDTDHVHEYLTETFKYLSMCYVLVPGDITTGNTVTLSFNLRQGEGTNNKKVVPLIEREIEYVPVQANYRTNILGGLYGIEDVPDPTSIFNFYQLPLVLKEKFEGNGNERYYSATINFSVDKNSSYALKHVDPVIRDMSNKEKIKLDYEDDSYKVSLPIFFTMETTEYEISVLKDYKIKVSSDVENDYYEVKTVKPTEGSEDERNAILLTIKSGATAGNFNIFISKQ